MAENVARRGRQRRARRGPAEDMAQDVPLNISALGPSHRANCFDEAQNLTSIAHERTFNEWPVICPRMITALEAIGLHLVRFLHLIVLDHHLFTALIERWSPRTNTFHLPVGEMTVTLQDVQVILGVRPNGHPLIGPSVVGVGRRWVNWEDCCDELLGGHPIADVMYVKPGRPDIVSRFNMGHSNTQLPIRWLCWTFYRESYEDLDEISFVQSVRAYILFLFGCCLLPDKSKSLVQIHYLPLLEDLEIFGQYSIGGAVLGFLYRELNTATAPSRALVGGCVHLLQVWSWERLYVGRPRLIVPAERDLVGKPLGYWWSANHLRETPSGNVTMYRDQLDDLRESQVNWTPYHAMVLAVLPPICSVNLELWTARVPLISCRLVEWHLPDRVMRQFDSVQQINIEPIESGFLRIDGRGRADYDWMAHNATYIALWNDRNRYITPITPPVGDGKYENRLYLQWYKSWASIYLLRPSSEPPRSYYPSAPENRLMRDYIRSTQQILGPYTGGHHAASSMQQAIDEVGELSARLNQQVHIDMSTYDIPSTSYQPYEGAYEARRHSVSNAPRRSDGAGTSRSGSQRSNPDSRRQSSFAGVFDYDVPFDYDIPSTSQYHEPSQYQEPAQYHEPMSSTQYSLPWMEEPTSLHLTEPPMTQEEDIILEAPQLSPRRARRAPSRFTPPTDAIPPRRRRRN